MKTVPPDTSSAPSAARGLVPPVSLTDGPTQAVSHGLAVLSTVRHYNRWIYTHIRRHMGSHVLEVGAGLGNITQFLMETRELVCLEPFADYREHLARRFADRPGIRFFPYRIGDCPNSDIEERSFDSIVCLNVVEHLEKDLEALRIFKRLLKPGGRAIVLTPAISTLYGEMDKAMGHKRRYRRSTLEQAFRQAGLTPVDSRYMNLIGAAAWFWHGRIRKKPTIPETGTRLFDRVVPFLAAAERMLPPPFGQSVLVVGKA